MTSAEEFIDRRGRQVVLVRELRFDESRIFLEVHHASIRGLTGQDYPAEVIEDWAPARIKNRAVRWIRCNPDKEIRFAAVLNQAIVGVGALVLQTSELRACYVVPHAARSGVGTAIVRQIERTALDNELGHLSVDSSLTAEPFYRALGYEALERGIHLLGSGYPMACVKMRKIIEGDRSAM